MNQKNGERLNFIHSFNKFLFTRDFQLDCGNRFHENNGDTLVYILYAQMSSACGGKSQFLTRLKSCVSLRQGL